jgi:hypothetical protein
VLLVYRAHESGGRRQDLIDEDEDGLLRRQLNALADHVDELTDRQVCRDQVLLLVDGRDVRLLALREVVTNTETYGNAVVVLLANALRLGLALLERVLVLELGTHLVGE